MKRPMTSIAKGSDAIASAASAMVLAVEAEVLRSEPKESGASAFVVSAV